MDLAEKSTSENAETDVDLSIHQKENQKQKGRRGRKKKIRPENDVIENMNSYKNKPEIFDLDDTKNSQNFKNTLHTAPLDDHLNNFLYRRKKILDQLYKDHMQVMNPDITPFHNAKHAYEYLLPYHIFSQPSYDDLVFEMSPKYTDLTEDVKNVTECIYNTIDEHEKTLDQNIVMDLLLTEEQKYIVSKYSAYLKNKKKKIKLTPKPIMSKNTTSTRLFKKNDRYKVMLKTKNISPTETRVILRPESSEK